MIDVCVRWEESDLKTALKFSIANHMKKSYLNWNKETVEDEVIFQHLYELSNGQIDLKQDKEDLTTSQELIKTKQNLTRKNTSQNNKKGATNHKKTK